MSIFKVIICRKASPALKNFFFKTTIGFIYSKGVVWGLLSSRPTDLCYPDHCGLNISIREHIHTERSMFKAHLMKVAATGIFQVTEMELKHLLLQLTELDSRLFDKSFVDLLYLFCNGKGAKQNKKKKKKGWTLWSNSLSFALHLLQPARPQTLEDLSQVDPGERVNVLTRLVSLRKENHILTGNEAMRVLRLQPCFIPA